MNSTPPYRGGREEHEEDGVVDALHVDVVHEAIEGHRKDRTAATNVQEVVPR